MTRLASSLSLLLPLCLWTALPVGAQQGPTEDQTFDTSTVIDRAIAIEKWWVITDLNR